LQLLDIFGTTANRSPADRLAHLSKPSPAPGYGYDYFDNPDYVGYGGYHYDGRYKAAAEKMRDHFDLKAGDKVLEIGCAKGFILYEFFQLGMDVVGLDASAYAIANSKSEIKDKLRLHTSSDLPFPDQSFAFVLAKEILPHLEENDAQRMIAEIKRVGRSAFLEIQCADTPESANMMKRWDQTHQTIKPATWWTGKLEEFGYNGAYHCRCLF
jgi:ubiquinone/menaquinone biosynthesis C-methylase UbiE